MFKKMVYQHYDKDLDNETALESIQCQIIRFDFFLLFLYASLFNFPTFTC